MKETTPEPELSVIIPSCERPESLANTLLCLQPSNQITELPDGAAFTYEVIVSDDGESVETRKLLSERFRWVRYVRGPRRGPAANRNCGAATARGRWLAFTDDDCLPARDWLRHLMMHAVEGRVVEGRTIPDRPRERMDEESPINETGGNLWSCNMMLERRLFESTGGFNENFPHPAIEDMEFRERLIDAGGKIDFQPEALVVHPWRPTKGISHTRAKLESWYRLIEQYPRLWPKSMWRYFLHRSLRRFFKRTLPGVFKYRCRGLGFALAEDGFYALQGIKALFRARN